MIITDNKLLNILNSYYNNEHHHDHHDDDHVQHAMLNMIIMLHDNNVFHTFLYDSNLPTVVR